MALPRFGKLNPANATPTPIPAPRLLPESKETEKLLSQQVRQNEAGEAIVNAVLEGQHQPTQREVDEEMHNENKKLDRLIDDDFPFDPSQLAAVEGLINSTHGCLTGAAGTGKTTTTKKLVDELLHSTTLTREIDLNTYFKKGGSTPVDDDDDYEITEQFVPSVVMCTFTGKASQQIKKNFPRAWHGNIMTIHRMLAYAPEWYEDMDEDGDLVNKMRFVPTYTAMNKMPWDIIIMDEAGMNSIDLWLEVLAAMKPGCRVYMIGDINQLPPVHGRSVFGFALSQWPSYELTTIHRQVGENNSIVDNAWRILKGLTPKDDSPEHLTLNLIDKTATVEALNFMVTNPDWKSLMLEVPAEPGMASKRIRQVLKLLQDRFYDPIRDVVITAINGYDTSSGRSLGQIPMNMELALSLNQNPDRFVIDGGRVTQNFAVGDKVMATKNDHQVGITNGMMGIIIGIEEHPGYSGDKARYGRVEDVANFMAEMADAEDHEFTLDELSESYDEQEEGREKEKGRRDAGPSSHIVTVRFGTEDHAFEISFSSKAEVGSLSTAYVVTCHKMQGGEAPIVFVICHHSHKQMLYREWLYTGWTRASGKIILLYTPFGLRNALNKQRIKGKNLAEKIQSFLGLSREYGRDSARTGNLPVPIDLRTGEPFEFLPQNAGIAGPVMVPGSESETQAIAQELDGETTQVGTGGIKFGARQSAPVVERVIVVERTVERVVVVETPAQPAPQDIDGGDLTPEPIPTDPYIIGEYEPIQLEDTRWTGEFLHNDQDFTPYEHDLLTRNDPHIRWPEPEPLAPKTPFRPRDRMTPLARAQFDNAMAKLAGDRQDRGPAPTQAPMSGSERLLAFVKAKNEITAPAPKFKFGGFKK